MSKWRRTTLGQIVAAGGGKIQTGPFGSQLHASDYVESGTPCIMPANMRNNRLDLSNISYISDQDAERLSQHLVQEGDIIYSRRGDVTQKALIRKHEVGYFCGTGCLLVRPGKEIDSEFLTYHLTAPSNQNWIVKQAVGATMPNLNTGILSEVPLRVPNKTEQRMIADVLSSLDAKIECNNRLIADLEEIAKTLYNYWFVQFDFPDASGKPYKCSGGKMTYNLTLKREIPAGWNANRLGKVAKTSLGGTPDTKNMEYWGNADIAWLTSAETATFPVVDAQQRINEKGIENSAAALLPRGSIVISIVRYIRPSILGIDAATNQSIVGILENETFKNAFLYPLLCGEVPRLMGLRTGAQQPHINKRIIDETVVVIPAGKVLENYYKVSEPIFAGIMKCAFENKHLTHLRDWLLPMLMNGQITVT